MEELGWERNISSSFPYSNINHHQQQLEETFIFGSDNNNIFFNPNQHLQKPGSITPATGHQIGSHRQLAVNRPHGGNNVIPLTTTTGPVNSLDSLDCLLSATNSNAYTTSLHQEEDISVIFKNFSDVVSSDDSVTKETDDGVDSQSSLEIKPNNTSGLHNGPTRSKRPRSDPGQSTWTTSSTINFRTESDETDSEVVAQMKEMIYTAAAFRPVCFADDDVAEKPRRKNVRISNDPQTVAARKRRERISERIRVLQKLVPGGNKMDTASMLDEAANYLKFLRSQVKALEQFRQKIDNVRCGTSFNAHGTSENNVVHNVTLGVPFPMHAPFLLPHQQIYPTLPPA